MFVSKVALADQKIITVFRTENLNSHFRELAKVPIKVKTLKRVIANYPKLLNEHHHILNNYVHICYIVLHTFPYYQNPSI
jgi:predicted translin family RNA/ssDNA-binding protein